MDGPAGAQIASRPPAESGSRPASASRHPRPATGGPVPPPEGSDGGSGGDWVELTTAQNQVVAHLIHGRLAEEGIECLMERPKGGLGSWLKPFGDPMAPVRLFVHRHDLGSASIVLHEVDHRPPDPASPAPRAMRVYWSMVVLTVLAAAILMALEVLGFAPCVLGVFCF